jgi:rod shape-determining protein MreC
MLLKPAKRHSNSLGVGICLLLGMTLGAWHNRAAAAGRTDVVTASVRTLTSPLVLMTSGVGRWFGRQIGWIFHGRSTEDEIRRLRRENAQLKEEVARLKEADLAVQRLRAQMGFATAVPPSKLAADIVSLRPVEGIENLILARGSRNGVRVHDVVVTPSGVVGQIADVAPTSASANLLTHPDSAVGALVQRAESRAVGICKGTGAELLSFAYLSQTADVKLGDTIITSGLGAEYGVYPKGIVIGTVVSVAPDASGSSKFVQVRPAVDFNRLEEVYVLK